ncbi:hypothetical protein AMTRI_Chr07g79580 [Amborella trichopoda]
MDENRDPARGKAPMVDNEGGESESEDEMKIEVRWAEGAGPLNSKVEWACVREIASGKFQAPVYDPTTPSFTSRIVLMISDTRVEAAATFEVHLNTPYQAAEMGGTDQLLVSMGGHQNC